MKLLHNFCLMVLVAFLATTIAIAQAADFSYIRGSPKGPEHWGDLRNEWATCKTGKMQSPIDLASTSFQVPPNSQAIYKFYQPGNTILKNKGYHLSVEWKDESGKIRINGKDYILRNVHWHSPSEHTINGIRFPLELHMVHQSRDNKLAVIGIVYTLDDRRHDPLIAQLADKIKAISNTSQVEAGTIDPRGIKMNGNQYYRYIGSLTTPPCTEGVIWSVNREPAPVLWTQVELLKNALREDAKCNNARPLQALNERVVHVYVQNHYRGEELVKEALADVAQYNYLLSA